MPTISLWSVSVGSRGRRALSAVAALFLLVLPAACVTDQSGTHVESASSQALPSMDRSSPGGQVIDQFRPEIADYLSEIEQAHDYPNWKAPPATAYQQSN